MILISMLPRNTVVLNLFHGARTGTRQLKLFRDGCCRDVANIKTHRLCAHFISAGSTGGKYRTHENISQGFILSATKCRYHDIVIRCHMSYLVRFMRVRTSLEIGAVVVKKVLPWARPDREKKACRSHRSCNSRTYLPRIGSVTKSNDLI